MRNANGLRVGLFLSVFAAGFAFGSGTEAVAPERCAAPAHYRTFDVSATNDPPIWIRWRLPAVGDYAAADGLEFELFCDNLTRYFEFVLRAYTDDRKEGAYHFRLQAPVANGWGRVVLKKSEVNSWLPGPIRGWGDIRFFELIGVRGSGRGAARVSVSDIRPHVRERPETVLVFGDTYIRDGMGATWRWALGRLARVEQSLDRLGVRPVTMSDIDLAKRGFPASAKLAVFPMNGTIPEGLLPQIEAFVAHGGKILYCRIVPKEVARLLSAKKCGLRTEFVFDRDEPIDARLGAMAVSLVPSFAANLAAARARKTADDAAARAAVAAFPSKRGEYRCISTHEVYGPAGRTWDEATAFVATNGFTHFSANLSTGEIAYYDSKVLTVAADVATKGDALVLFRDACHRHGLKAIAWRACFTLRSSMTPRALVARRLAEGRASVGLDGKVSDRWLCPNHPANRRTEIDAMVELAGKGVDGVALDYIRYSDDNAYCGCPVCRSRFEAWLGRRVANWPADVARRTGCLEQDWYRFREETITSLVREISAAVRKAHPGVVLSSSGFMNPDESRIGIGQNWAVWCRENLIDALGMMDYVNTFAGFDALIRDQRKIDTGTRCAVRPIFGPSYWPDAGDAAQALNAARHIQAIRDAGYDGFSFASYDDRAERILPILAKGPLGEK